MKPFHETSEFVDVLEYLELIVPVCEEKVWQFAPIVAKEITQLGLPKTYADWFISVEKVTLSEISEGRKYDFDGHIKTITKACIIGKNTFGDIVIDVVNGCVVDLDRSLNQSQLINTSLTKFLYFVGRMQKSANCQYSDASTLFEEFNKIDPVPMKNNEGIWSLTTFEAEQGMY